jgi:hypothetical protein
MQTERVTAGDDHAWPLRIVVRGEKPIQFVLEPWGDEYTVTSESVIEVVVYGPIDGRPPEIVHEANRIEVWASPGVLRASQSTEGISKVAESDRGCRTFAGSVVPSRPILGAQAFRNVP